MAIWVKNKLVDELLTYLENRPADDAEAESLHHELLMEKIEQEREEMLVDGTLPKTKGGAYII